MVSKCKHSLKLGYNNIFECDSMQTVSSLPIRIKVSWHSSTLPLSFTNTVIQNIGNIMDDYKFHLFLISIFEFEHFNLLPDLILQIRIARPSPLPTFDHLKKTNLEHETSLFSMWVSGSWVNKHPLVVDLDQTEETFYQHFNHYICSNITNRPVIASERLSINGTVVENYN